MNHVAKATPIIDELNCTHSTPWSASPRSGAYFERIGGGGDRPEAACQFTAEDLLAVTMLSVRIEGYHALEILHYQASELNSLLAHDQGLVQELQSVRDGAGAGHMSLLRVFDVMCWMFSWEDEHSPCTQEMPD